MKPFLFFGFIVLILAWGGGKKGSGEIKIPAVDPLFSSIPRSDTKKSHKAILCPREESNLNCKIRNLASYPLNDEGGTM